MCEFEMPGASKVKSLDYDRQRYRGRHLIENAFCRLKDFRRIAPRVRDRSFRSL